MKRLLIVLGLLMVTLTACGILGGGGSDNPPNVDQRNPIDWNRSPETIVFRADVSGGTNDPFYTLSEVPSCTIYGDNHIVWTNELGVNNVQILEDRLTDQDVINFVNYVALTKQLYNYSAKADTLPLTSNPPVVETLDLFVNNVDHKTDAFGGWDSEYYQEVLGFCRQLSTSPVTFVPSGAWLSARAVPYDSQVSRQPWDPAANGLSLKEIADSGQAKWITGRNVGVFWNMFLTSAKTLQFVESDIQYNIAIQVPNITRNAPAAPAS